MNFLLKNLELHIDEDHLILGERMVINQLVSDLREADKHLWVAYVSDNEVEIQITPSKVKACSCECRTFQTSNFCEHLAAALLTLRKHLTDKKEKKQYQRSKSSAPKKLTINTIFENAKKDDLITFMRQYAKGNRQFSLALKARFAGAVPMDNSYEKYKQLLDAMINSARSKNDNISYKGGLEILKVTKELLNQAKDAIALNDFTEALVILQCLIKKVSPTILKSGTTGEKLKSYIKGSFLSIEKIISLNPAPALKEEIRYFSYEECPKSIYRQNELSIWFFELLYKIIEDKKHAQKTIELLDNQLNIDSIPSSYQAALVIIKMNILQDIKQKRAANELITEYFDNPAVVLEVIQKSLDVEDYSRVEMLAKKGLKQGYKQNIKLELEEALFQVALLKKDSAKIIDLAEKRFLETLNYKYLDTCKTYYSEDWNSYLNTIVEKVKMLPYSILKRDILAEIYFKEAQTDSLLKLINDLQSLDLLKKYDDLLFEQDKTGTYQLYESFIKNYLKNHLGRKPSEKVREILNHIYDRGAFDLATKLVRIIRKEYPERHSLMEELELFA